VPEIIVVAGPNGEGKTSFANKHFDVPRPGLVYLNADEIARGLDRTGLSQQEIDIRAGREMLTRIDTLVAARSSFMLETTLASLGYLRKFGRWRAAGYRIALIYLRLPNVEMSLERVRRRVARGGHGIPDHIVKQRFAKSIDYLERHYKTAVDEWYIWNSLEGDFRRAEAWND
jgi:predicted ABC-type ATPase